MTLTIKKQFVRVTSEAAIACFESNVGFQLPQDYREFLLRSNGGEPVNPVFRFLASDGPYTDSAVRYFFSISDKLTFSLAHKYGIYSGAGRIAKEMLPIAADSGGNLVLLALAGPDAGKVFFWDHEIEALVDNPASVEHLTLIAKSFREFCDELTPFA